MSAAEAVRRTFSMLSPRMRRRWLLLLPFAIGAAILEAGAASGIYGFVLVFTRPDGALPDSLRRLVDWLPGRTRASILVQLAFGLSVFYLLKSAFVIWVHRVRDRLARGAGAELSGAMLTRYLSAPYPFHLRRNSSELIRNCTTSVQDAVSQVLNPVLALAAELVMTTGVVLVLIGTSPAMALGAAALTVTVTAFLGRITRRTATRFGDAQHALQNSILKTLHHTFGAIKEVKALGREAYFRDDFTTLHRRLRDLGSLWVTASAEPSVLLQSLLVCGALLVVSTLTAAGYGSSDILATAGVFGYASMRLIPAAQNAVGTLAAIRSRIPAVAVLYRDFTDLAPTVMPSGAGAPFQSAAEFRSVSFAYEGAGTPAIRDLSLAIHRGQSVGIVGSTGAGKSTLVDLLLGLLKPTTGTFTIDGRDVTTEPLPWGQRVGYVPQSLFLVDDTLRRNIALGIPDAEIDESRLREVVDVAQLAAFVNELPRGLDTVAGERGVRLSGGERQRVVIARALYHDPDLLVFDEATSSLDPRTEADVARTLEALHGIKTLVVIAHRLSTVRHCDTIVWMREGSLAAVGSFESLMLNNPEFRAFVESSNSALPSGSPVEQP